MTAGEEGPIVRRNRARSETRSVVDPTDDEQFEDFDLVFKTYNRYGGEELPNLRQTIYFRKGLAYRNNPGGAGGSQIIVYTNGV